MRKVTWTPNDINFSSVNWGEVYFQQSRGASASRGENMKQGQNS